MLRSAKRRQSGYMMILTLLVLVGAGGVVVANFTQDVAQRTKRERYLHNERVLLEAKRALLQYAYNYPNFNNEGPGRLPCPDDDNNGLTGPLELVQCTSIGRFPWAEEEMNFYDARDASGERLWYAVSNEFYNLGGGGIINSETTGSITIEDRSGAVIRDATLGQGVAAVIFTPGPAIARNGVPQDRAVGPNDPTNYLDLFGLVDNADFVNGTANGFVLGPIEDANGAVVNDQMIIITAEEVVAMAEKATLQTYQEALAEYDKNIDDAVGAGDHFPWLFDYDVNLPGAASPTLEEYPINTDWTTERDTILTSRGRIPSFFTEYFTDTDLEPFGSELGTDVTISLPPSPSLVGFTQPSQICPGYSTTTCTAGTIDFDGGDDIVFELDSSGPLLDLVFANLATDGLGRLSGTYNNAVSVPIVRYYWDSVVFSNGFIQCPVQAGDLTDCHRDSFGSINPGGTNQTASKVLEVTFTVTLQGPVNFDINYENILSRQAVGRADNSQHAQIQTTFSPGSVTVDPVTVTATYRYDSYYLDEFNTSGNAGILDVNDLVLSGPQNLTLRYYPVLPDWVLANDWHHSIMMAYAADRPDLAGACTVGVDCLQVNNSGGIADNKISLLAIARQHGWSDQGSAGLSDDVSNVFDAENADDDAEFDAHASGGNDRILVICDRGAGQCY